MSEVLQRESCLLATCTGAAPVKGHTFAAFMQKDYPSFGVEIRGDNIVVNQDAFNIAMILWQAYFHGWYDGQEAAIQERINENQRSN